MCEHTVLDLLAFLSPVILVCGLILTVPFVPRGT